MNNHHTEGEPFVQQEEFEQIARDYALDLYNKPGNEKLLKKVYNILEGEYLYGEELPQYLPRDVRNFFRELEYLGIEDLRSLRAAIYQKLKALQEGEGRKERIEEEAKNVRKKLTFLEQYGPQPVQWLEEHDRNVQSEVMSRVLELNPGDTVVYEGAHFKEMPFTVMAHNRQTKTILLEADDQEKRSIRYRSPAALEASVQGILRVEINENNKPAPRTINEAMKEDVISAVWAAEQARRRVAATKRRNDAA